MKRKLLVNRDTSPGLYSTPEIPVVIQVGMFRVGALYTHPKSERAGEQIVVTLLKKATLLGILALLAVMMWAGPASAAENGLMYYTKGGQIYSIDPTPNSQPKPILAPGGWPGPADDIDVSRNSQTIVYNPPCPQLGCVPGEAALYTLSLPNSDPYNYGTPVEITNLSSSATDIISPKFSPDGQTIYFAGKHILESDDDTYRIYSVPTNGGEATKIPIDIDDTTYFYAFDLSHDGSKFAIGTKGGIATVPVSGGVPTRITNDSCKVANYPKFSPDDQTIIYNLQFFTNDTCEGTPVLVTLYTSPVSNDGTLPGKAVFPEDLKAPYPTYATGRSKWHGTYSPDGKYIAFDNWTDPDGDGRADYYLVTAPATGGAITNIISCTMCDPVWTEKPDTTPPDTTITSKPNNPTNSTTASFSFSSTEPGSTFECSKDYLTWAACTSPHNYSDSTSLADGTYNFYVRAKDAAGNVDPTPASYRWTVDKTAPVAKAPAHSLITKTPTIQYRLGTSTSSPPNYVPVKLEWSGQDASGIAKYELQQSTNGGAFLPLSSSTDTTKVVNLEPSKSYRFQVRATDTLGNVSTFALGASFTPGVYQESSSRIVDSGGTWTTATEANSSGGSVQWASAAGRLATYSVPTGSKNVAWVSTLSPARGRAAVTLIENDVRQPSVTVDAYSANWQQRSVVYAQALDPSKTYKVEVKVLGTKSSASSSYRIDVDAFVATS